MSNRETNRLNVADIDFSDIRENLRDYLRSQDTLQDYDFEGSAISTIIDTLAYVTHYNALNANLGINETFLDTAQFRGSVVGHARMLGYTPRSASAPTAFVNVTVNNATPGPTLTIPRGHVFSAKIDNTTYEFVTTDEYTSITGTFEDVRIVQGSFKTAEFIFDTQSTERYTIPDSNVDTSTLRVEVLDSRTSTSRTVFTQAKEITTIDGESPVYFLSENPDGLFEISFGDGRIGRALENNNIIRVEYLVTQKEAGNGARIFNSVDPIGGFDAISVTPLSSARGGREKESISSIKRNAPITFASQNRGVIPQDYEAIIRENFSNVSSVRVWGGEDNDPPVYGKVFVSVNPLETEILSDGEKNFLLNEILVPKGIVSVTPEIVDPEFVYLTFEIFYKYDPTVTNLTEAQLNSLIQTAVMNYNDQELDRFNGVFRYSNFLSDIDHASEAILNTYANVYVQKRFVPTLNIPTNYTIDFTVPLFRSSGTQSVINSTSFFTYNGVQSCYLKDRLSEDGTERIVDVVTGVGQGIEIVATDVGQVLESKINLREFAPQNFEGLALSIEAIPESFDVATKQNKILSIDCDCERFSITGDIDPITSGRDLSGSDYTTPPRY